MKTTTSEYGERRAYALSEGISKGRGRKRESVSKLGRVALYDYSPSSSFVLLQLNQNATSLHSLAYNVRLSRLRHLIMLASFGLVCSTYSTRYKVETYNTAIADYPLFEAFNRTE
jgi:hypothetical protein